MLLNLGWSTHEFMPRVAWGLEDRIVKEHVLLIKDINIFILTHPETELASAAWEQGPSLNHPASPEAHLK